MNSIAVSVLVLRLLSIYAFIQMIWNIPYHQFVAKSGVHTNPAFSSVLSSCVKPLFLFFLAFLLWTRAERFVQRITADYSNEDSILFLLAFRLMSIYVFMIILLNFPYHIIHSLGYMIGRNSVPSGQITSLLSMILPHLLLIFLSVFLYIQAGRFASGFAARSVVKESVETFDFLQIQRLIVVLAGIFLLVESLSRLSGISFLLYGMIKNMQMGLILFRLAEFAVTFLVGLILIFQANTITSLMNKRSRIEE